MAALNRNDIPSESIEDKRKKCLLGELPDDFLRVSQQPRNANQNLVYPPMPPPQYITTQQLEMTIVQARLTKNYGITRMDPYCKVRVGHKTYETVTAFNGSKNPYWNKKFVCPIPKGVDAIHISIFDEKTMSSDEEIAYGLIPIPTEIMNGNVVDKWYPLSGRQGENQEGQINIVLSMKEVQVIQTPMYSLPMQPMMPGGYVIPPQQVPMPIQQTRIVIHDSDVDQLHEMFPAIEKSVIRTILEEQRGNKESSISALLSIADDVKET